jgi:transposase
MDLRERIADALRAAEESHPLIAERFGVSVTSVERISRRLREGRRLEPKKAPGPSRILQEKHLKYLSRQIERDPYVSSYDLTRLFRQRFRSLRVHRSTVLRAMHGLGLSFKKRLRTLPSATGLT